MLLLFVLMIMVILVIVMFFGQTELTLSCMTADMSMRDIVVTRPRRSFVDWRNPTNLSHYSSPVVFLFLWLGLVENFPFPHKA